MDPLTAALNLASATVTLLGKVWDATPKEQQILQASDIAKTLHNISSFINGVQEKINAVVVK
jgi:hypothetical protein